MNNTTEDLNELVLNYSNAKGEIRTEALKVFAYAIIEHYKQNGFIAISKEQIKVLMPSSLAIRTQQQQTKDIISFLVAKEKIKPIEFKRYYKAFNNSELRTIEAKTCSLGNGQIKTGSISLGNKSFYIKSRFIQIISYKLL